MMVYEIELRRDGKEYEYAIDASSGTILSFDLEWDKF